MAAIHFSSRTKTLLIWGGIVLALAFLYLLGSIVTPFLWALITAFILNAVVAWATRRVGGPRWVWVLVVYFGLVAAVVWGLIAVAPVLGAQIRQLIDEVPNYMTQLDNFVHQFQLGDIHFTSAQVSEAIRTGANNYLGGLGSRAPELVLMVAERLLKVLLFLVATFYFLLQADNIVRNVRGLFPSDVLEELDPWIKRITATLTSYLRGQVLLIAIVCTATFIGLEIMGVRFALVLAIMSGLVETVPYIGPYAAGGIAVVVGMTQPEPNNFGWPPLILGIAIAVMYTVIRQVEDNLVMPFVIGRTVELHPLTVIFVVLAGASLGGVLGLLIAVPAAATIKIILEFLWEKIKEPDPRESLVVSARTTWDTLARRMRAARGQRLVLIVPQGVAAPALREAADYRRLVLLAGEQQVDLKMITNSPQAAQSAHSVGILVEEQPADQFAHTAAATGVAVPAESAADLAAEAAGGPEAEGAWSRPAAPPAASARGDVPVEAPGRRIPPAREGV